MGLNHSHGVNNHHENHHENFKWIKDHFSSYGELEQALRDAGLESSQLIVGIDFTRSNTWQGGPPYYVSNNLHEIGTVANPYQQVLSIICKSLAPFDDDQLIPSYGFGDIHTTDKGVFSFIYDENGYEVPCHKLEMVSQAYNHISSEFACGNRKMSGPTSFGPIIRKAIEIVNTQKQYHILLIICDGAVDSIHDTVSAIVEASKYPLSIVCIGVGRGPWDTMKHFDDKIPRRNFDNFQFVDFHEIMKKCENEEVEFAKHALMEIPLQYKYIKSHIL